MNKKYIFLDFDGVMHPEGKQAFSCAEYFAQSIKDLEDINIVFSTSWREYSSVERLAKYMPESIRDKCIGKTPVIRDCYKHVRYQEIMAFNKENKIKDNQWIAIDDMPVLFPKDCKNLILTNSKIGFSEKEAQMINLFHQNKNIK